MMSIRLTKLNHTAVMVDSLTLNRTIGALVKNRPDAQGWVFSPSDGLVFKQTTLTDVLAAMKMLADADTKAEQDEANRREIARLQNEIDGIVARDDEDDD